MDRYAAAVLVEIYGRKVVFASIHLDHHENPQVRLAQAERLESELDRIVGDSVYCRILAGDFNDAENSPVMAFLKAQGYQDCYRACHSEGGNTFPTQHPSTRLDYIMVKATGSRVLSSELVLNNHEMSDHLGVVTVIA
jgi:endonuclease/exonuclease/phosphatase family metal-dependent hydrolase